MKREKLQHASIDYMEKLFGKNSIKSLIDIEAKVHLKIGIEWKRKRNDGIRSCEFRNNRDKDVLFYGSSYLILFALSV